MVSKRLPQQQLALEFDIGDDVDELTTVAELQLKQSVSATMKQPSPDQTRDSLMEKIVDAANMMRAWTNVRRNAGAPVPDGITVDEFSQWLAPRWPAIRQHFLDGS